MKIRVLIFAALISSLGFAIEPSCAEPLAKNVVEMYDRGDSTTRKLLDVTIVNISNGLMWANNELTKRKTPPLYCQPENLAINGSQLIDIVRRTIGQEQRLSNYPLGMVLLISMQRVFPCERQSN